MLLAAWLLPGRVVAQNYPLPPMPNAPADSGRVVRGMPRDTARRAAADTTRARPASAPKTPPVSLAGLTSLRARWVRLDAQGRGRLTDSVTVVPGSLTLPGRPGAGFEFDPQTGKLLLDNAPPAGQKDSVLVQYRVLPLNLTRPVFRRDRRTLDSLAFRDMFFTEAFAPPREEILRTPGLTKSGNLARGISFGNAQNVFVNSALNLQLEGKLAEKLNLTASITDQNVPFQPEGNTQQLQQFDRIFITLENPDRWRITAGDVVLRNRPGNFLRFYKNIQGGALEVASSFKLPASSRRPQAVSPQAPTPNTQPSSPQTLKPSTPQTLRTGTTLLAAGIAKGKFASQQVPPLDNVQGPYRLTGPNGERFIIILAGSERVYLDGQLLQRGFDFDYTIDYNQAEITFSPRHLITRNARIRVEYEYSDQNYARTIANAAHYQQWDRWNAAVNIYREADNPDNAPNLSLKSPELEALQDAGDSLRRAVVPGADSVRYNRAAVQYARIDTLGEVIYRYTRDSATQHYDVRFSDVGAGQGDYVQATSGTINGRVFQYVGRRQGRYLPLRILPAPTLRQLATASVGYQLDPQTTITAEVAASQLDRNRFSSRDDQDNNGVGLRVGYAIVDRKVGFLGDWKLRSAVNYEFTDRRFSPIDRYRDVEFDRDWSATSTTGTGVVGAGADDNILNASVGVAKDVRNQVTYRISRRYRAGEVQGIQHWVSGARQVGDFTVRGALFLLTADAARSRSRWRRGETGADWQRPNAALVAGYAYRFDQNRVLALTTARRPDSVLRSANYFDEHTVYVRSNDEKAGAADDDSTDVADRRLRYRLDYAYRRTFLPLEGEIRQRDRAQTWQGTLNARIGRHQELAVLATYREVTARPGVNTGSDSTRESAVLAKLDHTAALFDQHVRSELSYSVATGREARRLYQFQPTTPGQGTHYLPPGANPADLNAYIEAQSAADPSQRLYIKVFLASDEYVVAYTNRFTYRLTTQAPRAWRGQGRWKDLANRFSNITFVSLDRRTIDPALANRLNPFSSQSADDQLLALNQILRSTLFFNRASPAYGAELNAQQSQQKTLLTSGSETRSIATQGLTLRRALTTVFVGKLDLTRTIRQTRSTALLTRNYRILAQEIAPEIAWQPSQTFRLTGTYRYTTKRDTDPVQLEPATGAARGTFHELGLEQRYSRASKRTITGLVRFTQITFEGPDGTPVAFDLLNALRPGNNLTWQLTVEQRLANGLNISVAYDGRKPSGVSAIHTGRMQVSVLF